MRSRALLLAVLALAGCTAAFVSPGYAAPGDGSGGAGAGAFKLRVLAVAADSTTGEAFDPGNSASGVRYCRYLPGASAAVFGSAGPEPDEPLAPMPPSTAVPAEVTAAQLQVFDELLEAVATKYVDPAFNGKDWPAIGAAYRAKVQSGLTQDDFYKLMKRLVGELDDEHSNFQTHAEVVAEEEAIQRGASFVGIGAGILPQPDGSGSVIYLLPGSPAEAVGLLPHDLILSADGGPLLRADGTIATRGEPGTPVTLRIKRGIAAPFSVTVNRQAITAHVPIDSCIVAGTRIGYIRIPTFLDNSIPGQVESALDALMAQGPLDGLVLDNRINGGGIQNIAQSVLGFFTSGTQGAVVGRTSNAAFSITPTPIGNSQTVPLVVLVGEGTVSFGEISSGVLGRSGRATIIGTTTQGNVELLQATNFADGSRAWLAVLTFQPVGLPAGTWEDTGIVPSVTVNGLWHEYTEVDDPAFAAAVKTLSK